MSNWVVAVLVLNAALVVAVIVLALRIGSRNVLVALKVDVGWNPSSVPVSTPDADAYPPLFSSAQMTPTEWRALLDAFDAARLIYVRQVSASYHAQPSADGALTRAKHDLEVAQRRLTRFEVKAGTGVERDSR